MPIARINGQSVLFVHIPKTGGETTEKYLESASETDEPLSLLRPPDHDLLPCAPQHLHGKALNYLFRPKFFDYAFTIVRDPVARAVSEYKFRAGPLHAKGRRIPTFPAWWQRTRKAYASNPYVADNHLRPQMEFITPRIAARFDVFRFEDGLLYVLEQAFAVMGVPFRDLDIHTHRSEPLPIEIDEATFNSLLSFYARDINELGYDHATLRDRHLTKT